MSEKMLKFVGISKETPGKIKSSERTENFHEIYKEFIENKASEQASRCSQCGVPFCQVHCPLHNNIPDWLKLTAEGRLEEAYRISSSHKFYARSLWINMSSRSSCAKEIV